MAAAALLSSATGVAALKAVAVAPSSHSLSQGKATGSSHAAADLKSTFFGKSPALAKAKSATVAHASNAPVRVNVFMREADCGRRARQMRAAQALWAANQRQAGRRCEPSRAYANPWMSLSDCMPQGAMVMGPMGMGMGFPWGRTWRGQAGMPGLGDLMQELSRTLRSVNGWDVEETQDAWLLRVDLPGFGAEDVKVQIEDGKVLKISAKQQQEEELPESARRFRARQNAGFETRLPLPNTVFAEKVSAELKKGVLLVTLPKREAPEKKSTVLNIDINQGSNGAKQESTSSEESKPVIPEFESESGSGSQEPKQPENGNGDSDPGLITL